MLKRFFTIASIFLCAFGLTGCEKNIFEGGAGNYYKSPDTLFKRFCYLSENNGTYEEFIDLFPVDVRAEAKDALLEDSKLSTEVAEVFTAKECKQSVEKDLPKEEVQSFEDYYNREYDNNREVLECKKMNLSLDDEYLDEVFTCKFKDDGKWYVIGD